VYQLIFTPEAQTDSINAVGYYESKLPGLGKRFKQEIKRQLAALKLNPHTRSVRYENVRLAVIEKFPYSIHYSILDQQVIVHAIICDYRNPAEYWVK
jgi:plasmid stabilization system protein ParE